MIEDHLGQLDQQMAGLLAAHHDAVQRLAEVPGLGVDSAQQIIAEVGATAATFPSSKQLASWVGACPGDEESAGVNYSHRCPKGNRQMRRVLNQAADAAVKAKGTIFAIVYRRLVPRLGHAQAIGAITHVRWTGAAWRAAKSRTSNRRERSLVWHGCHWAARTITLRSVPRRRIRMTLTVKNQIIGGKFAAIAGPQPPAL